MAAAPDILPPEEIARFWVLAIPLEAVCLPDDELRRALLEGRVERAFSSSSMGTAETYWSPARDADTLEQIRGDGVVLPVGQRVVECSFEDRIDDRNVHLTLWQPLFRRQRNALLRAMPALVRATVLAEYAEILASLEEQWADEEKRVARAPFLVWLRSRGPVGAKELALWLREHKKKSVSHLARGIRARWITQDLAAAYDAVIKSAARFQDTAVERSARMRLLRFGARVASEQSLQVNPVL